MTKLTLFFAIVFAIVIGIVDEYVGFPWAMIVTAIEIYLLYLIQKAQK